MNSQVAKILLLSFALITHVQAEDLPLEHTETVVSVPPNVFMSVDNSGSMRFNYAMNREWTIDTYTDYNPSLYTATYPIRYYQSSFKHDWRSLSSDFNTLAYNPNKKYQPWPGYPDANYDKVRYHPDRSHTDNYNKSSDLLTLKCTHITTSHPNSAGTCSKCYDIRGFSAIQRSAYCLM